MPAPDRPHETEKERLDRNFQELLGGLRVALPGIQVMFAFLLLLPFQRGFDDVTAFQERVYFVALAATALSSVLLIAGPVRHRILFRRDAKYYVVFSASRLAIIGLTLLGVAICAVMLLVSDYLFDALTAGLTTGTLAAVIIGTWFAAPLARRRRYDG
ncbi:MAG TPA: DUF6328 family protein [Solirubrobacterales bacterium]|nr:DUF6328 family protein [Solirubrobacterales bacterium]